MTDRSPHHFNWLLVQLRPLDLADLVSVTELELREPQTPAARRARELGALAELLNQLDPKPGLSFPIVARQEYDVRRAAGAPSADTLARRHGSWSRVCARAFGVQPDGTYDRARRNWRGNQPWPNWNKGKPGIRQYTRDEILDAIRLCAEDLGRTPSQLRYREWSAAKHREARRRGQRCRIPSLAPVARLFPTSAGGWRAALAAAFRRERQR